MEYFFLFGVGLGGIGDILGRIQNSASALIDNPILI